MQVDNGNEAVAKYVEFLDQYNDQDDNNAELSKICSIFGKGYEMYYVDENGNIGITYLSPLDAFMIYDDSVLERERYFVRLILLLTEQKIQGQQLYHLQKYYFRCQPLYFPAHLPA